MKTIGTLFGDWDETTTEAAKALSAGGVPFRVCLSRDTPGIPTLSMPFGELHGLDDICAYADGSMANKNI